MPRATLNVSIPTPLASSFDHQDETFASAFGVVREAIAQQAFPAASVGVAHNGRLIALKSFGRITTAPVASCSSRSSQAGTDADLDVSPATLFDVASLTKPVATTTMAAILYQRGLLELDSPVVGTLPEFLADSCSELDPRRHDVTFRMLLAHSSGLPAYERLFLNSQTRDELLFAAITTGLSSDPGTRVEYSDIGFIILGAALERITEESMDVFCQREIFGPLAMLRTTFNPPADMRRNIPPTADEREEDEREEREGGTAPSKRSARSVRQIPAQSMPPSPGETTRSKFRKRIIQGEVQDENASVLGGVAPHAGLFSTAEDLSLFAHAMLQAGSPILRPETAALFTHRESSPAGTSRALGWDTPSGASQSGEYFGQRSYGHLGYTGTSLWVDPDRQLSITLLTNRTWPDCSNHAIKQLRPKFHDAVVEALK